MVLINAFTSNLPNPLLGYSLRTGGDNSLNGKYGASTLRIKKQETIQGCNMVGSWAIYLFMLSCSMLAYSFGQEEDWSSKKHSFFTYICIFKCTLYMMLFTTIGSG